MKGETLGDAATALISTAVIAGIILIGLITFSIAAEFEKDRQMAGLPGAYAFNPDELPAPGAGIPEQAPGVSPGCEGVIFRAADNGTRYVKESGGGRYYAAEVNNRFGIYIVNDGYLLRIADSSMDIHVYRKLKHALYYCDGAYTQSGLRIPVSSSENIQA